MATTLAVVGLFGLVAYSVSQRRRQLGILAAIGARPVDLIATRVRSAVIFTAIGIATGLSIAVYLTRFIKSQLYAVDPLDISFAGPAILMTLAAGVAAYWPALRAARADLMDALSYE